MAIDIKLRYLSPSMIKVISVLFILVTSFDAWATNSSYSCVSLFQRKLRYNHNNQKSLSEQFQRIGDSSYLKSRNNRYVIKMSDRGQIEDVLVTYPRVFPTGAVRLLWFDIVKGDETLLELYYAEPRKEGVSRRKLYKVTLRKNKNGRIDIYNVRPTHPLITSTLREQGGNLRHHLYKLGFKRHNSGAHTYTLDLEGSTFLISQVPNHNFLIAGSGLTNKESIIDESLHAVDIRRVENVDALILKDDKFEYVISPRGGIISVNGVSK